MMKSYKFRLYPNKRIERNLLENLDVCRWLYNRLLQEMNMAKDEGLKLNRTMTQTFIPYLREWEAPFLVNVNSKVLQMVNYILWSNVKSLSELKKNGKKIGRLRFKGKGWFKTINFNQSGFKFDIANRLLLLSKIGEVKCIFHRKIEGAVKSIIIKKTLTCKWFVIILCEVEPIPLSPTNRVVGFDLGIETYSTDSDGIRFENPKFIDRGANAIKKAQRKVSHSKRGSSNRRKLRVHLAKVHERVANQRNDFLHKLSKYYVDNYDEIYTEELNIKNMVESHVEYMTKAQNRILHRHDMDSSWRKFINMVSSKAENADRIFKLINTLEVKPSQRCVKCDHVQKKELWERNHQCGNCGLFIPRDYNSALVIKASGSGRPVEPVELESLSPKVSFLDVIRGQIPMLMQEATSLTVAVREGVVHGQMGDE